MNQTGIPRLTVTLYSCKLSVVKYMTVILMNENDDDGDDSMLNANHYDIKGVH